MTNLKKTKSGQHFLHDHKILDFMITSADIKPNQVILEVGAGYGNLTIPLANVSRKVIAVEKDQELCKMLSKRIAGFHNIEIIQGDLFNIHIPTFDKIIASPPYYISANLFKWLLKKDFQSGILLLQKEFTEKVTATPGSRKYGTLTVLLRQKFKITILKDVSPSSFFPPPQVMSSIVKIINSNSIYENNFRIFFENMVNSFFSTKRKSVSSVIRRFVREKGFQQPVLSFHSSILTKRVNELSIQEIDKIAHRLYHYYFSKKINK